MCSSDLRFGAERIFGGQCAISATLDAQGAVQHLNRLHSLTFGERDGSASARMQAITGMLGQAGFDARPSDAIVQEMWDKWVFIATGAGITCLMRATVGEIEAAGGAPIVNVLLGECAAIAARAGFAPADSVLERARRTFMAAGSDLTASMFRDLERGGRTEGDHLLGDLLRRGTRADDPTSILRVAYVHVAAYEVRRAATA